MIAHLKMDYPVTTLCEVLDCPRSTVYYEPQAKPSDGSLMAAIDQILMRYPFYGYRRVLHQLRREGWPVGEHVVRRVLREMGHRPSVGKVRVQTTHSQHNYHRYPNLIRGMQAQRPNDIWVADITYIRYGRQFWYLAVILDACTRGVRGWHLSDSLEADTLTVTALHQALTCYEAPRIFHSDQGSQYACGQHIDLLLDYGVLISMSDKGDPTQNGLAERFMRTLKEEHVDYTEYRDYEDALTQLRYWLEVEYMTERIHSALAYKTPLEFELEAWANPQNPLLLVR